MTTYSIRTNFNEYSQSEINRNLIEDIINSLNPDVWDFLVLSPSNLVQGSTFIQVGAPDEIVDNKYTIELVLKTKKNRYKTYRYYTEDKNLVYLYLIDYLEKRQIPDISSWEDVTHENPNFR